MSLFSLVSAIIRHTLLTMLDPLTHCYIVSRSVLLYRIDPSYLVPASGPLFSDQAKIFKMTVLPTGPGSAYILYIVT